jgi:AcrR family transcriptional regulator
MAAVAERADVSEPTLYRSFPTKRDLFGALASHAYVRVTEGVAPTSAEDMANDVKRVDEHAEGIEATVCWLLAAPDPAGVPRPNVERRLPVLREALADQLANMSPTEADHMLRAVLLITSPMALLYWKDYLGISAHRAAATAAWMIRRLAR